ncbi:hypothetical protein H1R20_g15805, partial [Candolleomyces eurysporus]
MEVPVVPLFNPPRNPKFLAAICTRFITHLFEECQENESDILQHKLKQFISHVFEKMPALAEAVAFGALLLMQQVKHTHGLKLGVHEGAYGEPFATGHALFITALIIAQKEVIKESVSHGFWSTTVSQGILEESLLVAMEREVRESLEGKMTLDYETIVKFRRDVAYIHGMPVLLALARK